MNLMHTQYYHMGDNITDGQRGIYVDDWNLKSHKNAAYAKWTINMSQINFASQNC